MLFHSLIDLLRDLAGHSGLLGVFRALYGPFHGEMAPHIAALRADEHSAFRIVPVIDERVSLPVSRNEVTSEAVFQVAGVVQWIVKPDDELFPAPPGRLVGFPVSAVVASIYNIRTVVLADQARLFYGVDAFADGDLGHDVRNVVFQGLKTVDPLDQFILVYPIGRPLSAGSGPAYTLRRFAALTAAVTVDPIPITTRSPLTWITS